MNREQFRMSLPTAIAAAVDVVRASIAFAPVDNNVPDSFLGTVEVVVEGEVEFYVRWDFTLGIEKHG